MKYFLSLLSLLFCTSLVADANAFSEGSAIKPFGKIAKVEQDVSINSRHKFKVVFDVGKQGTEGASNRSFDSLARFKEVMC